MKTRLTPYYNNLIYEACLKSFWRKRALSNFLRQCGVAENFISTWDPGESKRNFLDRLFSELPKTDRGRNGLLRISICLTEQETFPDLENWEDSAQKIKDARQAVLKLKSYHNQQEKEIESEETQQRIRPWGDGLHKYKNASFDIQALMGV